jgi:hypothetical protein
MIYLSAQPLQTYFLWQTYIYAHNFHSLGIPKEEIHILFSTTSDTTLDREDEQLLEALQSVASIYLYADTRIERKYSPSIRPHIIAKHFHQYDYLTGTPIFYHDSDIIFREIPPILQQKGIEAWYGSDTSNYVGSQYIKSVIGEDGFNGMCGIVGIDSSMVIEQDKNCIGAQYVMINLTAEYWEKVETDCVRLYDYMECLNLDLCLEHAISNKQGKASQIQSWCTDMWAVLWNAAFDGHTLRVHSDLSFSWIKGSKDDYSQKYILHNAGVTSNEANTVFCKIDYYYTTPFCDTFPGLRDNGCSRIYLDHFPKPGSYFSRYDLKDLTFMIPVMVDSVDRKNNLLSLVKYLNKYFDTHILIVEFGETAKADPGNLPEGVSYFFNQGASDTMHHTGLNNFLIKRVKTKFLSIIDTDAILPASQLMEAYSLLNDGYDMVYPYDGSFVSMDSLLSSLFHRNFDDQLFVTNKEKGMVDSRRSVGGCVCLNTESYRTAGGDNEAFTSWGPEDRERYHRMRILGYKIARVEGPLFHLHHQRNINSGYRNAEAYSSFMEEYFKVFNMKKDDLLAYVSTWQAPVE